MQVAESKQISIRLVNTQADAVLLRSFWEANADHPLALFDVYWELIRTRPEITAPYILVAEVDGKPSAIALLRLERRQVRVRVGYWICCRQSCVSLTMGYGGLIGRWENDVARMVASRLNAALAEGVADMLYLDGIKVDGIMEGAADAVIPARQRIRGALGEGGAPHYVVDLPASGDEFLAALPKRQRETIRSKTRRLHKDFQGQVEFRCSLGAEGVETIAHRLEKVAAKTYHRQLGAGFQADAETISRMRVAADEGRFRCYSIEAGGETRCFYYGIMIGSSFYPSYTGYDPDFAEYDLGTLLLNFMVQQLCAEQAKVLDFGGGDAFYKRRYATRSWQEGVYYAFAPGLRGAWLKGLVLVNLTISTLQRRLARDSTLAQRMKTWWRQRLAGRAKTDPTQDTPSGQA